MSDPLTRVLAEALHVRDGEPDRADFQGYRAKAEATVAAIPEDTRDRLAYAASHPDCGHHCEEGHYTGDDMTMMEQSAYHRGYEDATRGLPRFASLDPDRAYDTDAEGAGGVSDLTTDATRRGRSSARMGKDQERRAAGVIA